MTSLTDLPLADVPVVSERALPAGTRLDDCEIERVLAQGSFALVYRAYDHALRLHVAIKEYLPDALAMRSDGVQVTLRSRTHAQNFELGRRAFIAEAQTLARCEHPSLLRVDRIVERHGTVYRVMRYSPGPTLLEHRRALAEAPDESTLRAWLDGLLGALSSLHDEGCVHTAVAPGNILLLPGERPLLLDFDAVRNALISDRTQGLMAALEPSFAPVELRNPSPELTLGPWTDLYSLAATLHFGVSGQLPPPPARTAQGAGFEPLAAVWQRLQAGAPGRPDAPTLLRALDACLAEAPQDRPQSVAQLRDLLDAPGMVARPAPAPAPSKPSSQAPQVDPAPLPVSAAASSHPTPRPPAQARTRAEVAPPIEPDATAVREPLALDAANARVIADLDRAFAIIAAQANEDAASTPAPSTASTPTPATMNAAARATSSPPPSAATARRRSRRLQWVGAATVLLLVVGVGAWRLTTSEQRADPDRRLESLTLAAAPAMPGPTLPDPPTGAGPSDRAAAVASTPPADSVASRSVTEAPAVASANGADAARSLDSPRALCGKRTGYALYQCMQTQCAKRTLAKHPQCQRLKQSQSLS